MSIVQSPQMSARSFVAQVVFPAPSAMRLVRWAEDDLTFVSPECWLPLLQ